jgi:hypothetical protein
MSKRKLIRGEKHHWWPVGLSQHWANEFGFVHRITPNGAIQEAPPKKLASISDGHNITFKELPSFEHTFEQEYDRADTDFPMIIKMLDDLRQRHPKEKVNEVDIYFPHRCEMDFLNRLCGCLVSLVVRAPKFRNSIVGFFNAIGSTIVNYEHKRTIAMNMVRKQEEITASLNGSGKFVVLFSESSEFIFGDGFYHNISMNGVHCSPNVRMLVPLTPNLAILYVRPMAYMPEPRLMTRLANRDLVMMINETVQIYSKECLFYKSEKPTLSEHFVTREHLEFTAGDPVDELIESIPGVGRMQGTMFRF